MFKVKRKYGFIALVALLSFMSMAWSAGTENSVDPKEPNIKLKAHYLYNFAKLVDWPEKMKSGEFVFSVFGNSKVEQELKALYNNKYVGNQAIRVESAKHTDQLGQVHILYVPHPFSGNIQGILNAQKGKSVLLVTEKEGGLKMGSVINFVIHSNKQAYELSKSNASKRKLILGSTLEKLAVKVE